MDADNLSARDAATIYRDFSAAQVLYHTAVAELIGLSPGDYKCLDLLMRSPGPLTATALARLCGLTTGAVTGVVDRLERAGYAVRTRDAADRRRVRVSAAGDVEERLRWIFEPLGLAIGELEAGFVPAELAVIRRYLYRATEVFGERTAALRKHTGNGGGPA